MDWGKNIRVLVISLVAVVGVLIWLLVLYIFPMNPAAPYFSNVDDRIGGFHWNLGEFQPVYLFPFKKDNDYFIKVAYRDSRQKIKLMNIFIGSEGQDPVPFSVVMRGVDEVYKINKVDQYGKYFHFGSRVHLTYLRNVTKRSGDYLEIIEPTEENTKNICEASKVLCMSIKLVTEKPDSYWDFATLKNFPDNLLFPVISLDTRILDK